MKLVLIILVGLSLAVAGWFNNVKEGLEIAKKENRPVAFYFFMASLPTSYHISPGFTPSASILLNS